MLSWIWKVATHGLVRHRRFEMHCYICHVIHRRCMECGQKDSLLLCRKCYAEMATLPLGPGGKVSP